MLPTIRKNNLLADFFENDLFGSFANFFDSSWKQDKDGNHVFEVECPGFNSDNLSVEINEGILTISGETETRKIFKRYQIGNITDVDAKIKDGILSLTLKSPKTEAKKIELKS